MVPVPGPSRPLPPPDKVFVHGAGRCGECHNKMFDEWEVSAHARAVSSGTYQAAVADAGKAGCGDKCHAPLTAATGKDGVASEGVTCDVCHTMRDPKPSAEGGEFTLAIDDMVKYGPRCDLKDHYFHRMGCSKVHQQAEVCGSCHWWEPKGVPVFTEYKDWRDGPAATKGTQCQGCHMPEEKAALAQGAPVRTGVAHHGLLGIAGDLRTRMIGGSVSVAVAADGSLDAEVHVKNMTAGHYIPAGLPERRIQVTFVVQDATGVTTDVQTIQLGRQLVDDKGALAPFWRATKLGKDTRIAPGAEWVQTFAVEPDARGGEIVVSIDYLGLDPAIAKLLDVGEREETQLVQWHVPFGAKQGAGRAKLPAKVSFTPPLAGARTLATKKK
ncbi:MAG TPA: multiheme c-type cytochrome [Kofleriaceae bacterium]|jgi:hypothetical protein